MDLVALDDVLNLLANLDQQASPIVNLRFYGEIPIEETAVVLDVSPAKVKREWATARNWLQREMRKDK